MRSGQPNVLEINDWISRNFSKGQVIGFDPFLLSAGQAKALKKLLAANDIIVATNITNPIDVVWNAIGNRPPFPANPLRIIDIRSAGVSHLDKIRAVQRFVVEKNAEGILVSMLDEIAWLFNVRGSDISFNPVTIAYAVITRDQAILFIDSVKITPEISAHLGAEVIIRPYEDIVNFVKQVVSVGPLLMDPSRVNWGVYLAAEEGDGSGNGSGVKVIDSVSPIALNKSRKNEAELAGIRACHIRDGVALTAFLHWLEVTVKNSQQQVPSNTRDLETHLLIPFLVVIGD